MVRPGFSLTGLLIIIGILYFSGAGAWLWERVRTLDSSCYALLDRTGMTRGSSVCSAIGSGVQVAGESADHLRDYLLEMIGNLRSRLPAGLGGIDFQSFTDRLMNDIGNGSSPLNRWASSSSRLQELMGNGPEYAGNGATASQRIRAALDNFIVGQRYMQADDSNEALRWLGQGAQQPGYGVLSQMALGNIYQHGTNGVQADPLAAAQYYQQAQSSITALSASQAPEAQQMLQNLPASPQVIQQQLGAVIVQMRQAAQHH